MSSYACHEEGQYVQPGDIVAYAGNTGNSQGAHLHLEVIECKLGMGDLDWNKVLDTNKNKKLMIDGWEDDKKSCLSFFNGEKAYYVSGTSYGHGAWTDNRLNPLTGRKKWKKSLFVFIWYLWILLFIQQIIK